MRRELLALTGLGLLAAAPGLLALETHPAARPEPAAQAAPAPQTPPPSPPDDEAVRRAEEITVESASKVEQKLVDAPATMSVVTEEALVTSPAQNYADLLRSVPGMNVIQMGARDINLTTRQSTSTLNNSQLVLVDGRSVYLDFFGLVLWDLVPSPSSNEVKQIEIVRGPASVPWGANALTGVVNILTKTPRENEGFGLTLSGGLFNRDGGSREADGTGQQFGGSFYFAKAINDTLSYKLSAGYYDSDPYSRPVGLVPFTCHPYGIEPCRGAGGAELPGGYPMGGVPFPADEAGTGNVLNQGTSQPKVNLRVDQDFSNGGRMSYEGGYAGTDGLIHTGTGPFDIQSGSFMAYGKLVYTKNALRIGAFGNFVDVEAPNLLQRDTTTLQPVVLGFKTETYDIEVGNTNVLGGKHILTYGGNYRRNNFDITVAPLAEDRNEFGVYLQEEFFVEKFRLALGARADKFGNLDHWVFSPRVSLMFKPGPAHSIRATYNRAFRSPSTINNYLDLPIFSPTAVPLFALLPPPLRPLAPPEPIYLILSTFGNPDLKEEHIDAYELAYTGTVGSTTFGLAVYQNDTDDNINFTTLTPSGDFPTGLPGFEAYSVSNPARGVGSVTNTFYTLSPQLMAILGAGGVVLPYKVATYLNLGPIRNRGIEASIDHRFNNEWNAFVNYSWQDDPEILDAASDQIEYPVREVALAPEHRFNAGISYSGRRFIGNVNVNYSGEALWTDVLAPQYAGYTDAYTLLNATLGVKLANEKLTLSLRGVNLLNEEVRQHIYGDLMRRSVVAELRFFTK
jgi:outer membrane receptor protein involved in Fe transport